MHQKIHNIGAIASVLDYSRQLGASVSTALDLESNKDA